MAKNLVIVESPAKAKTLKKFLGSNYKIEASVGHVRDLPKSDLGVDIENDYEPRYITIRGKGDILAKLRKDVKNANKVFLATDPDREGEAISWHLKNALKLDEEKASRITFNEITKNAVKKSIKEARQIDMNLVNAQQARRVLDRVVGYKISPLLWKKVKKGLSAGRVQSVALKIICDREEEIENFIQEEYWSVEANLKVNKEIFNAKLHSYDGEKIQITSKENADKIIENIKKEQFIVNEVKESQRIKKPLPPFTTSTLQQEASKILGFPTNKTMFNAQQLYEGVDIKGQGTIGLLTYIRTDSTRISDEAFIDVKELILNNYGKEFVMDQKQEYKTKNRSQDAHEAIRPTYVHLLPDEIKDSLTKDQYKLYKLVWERFVASQMKSAIYNTLSIKLSAGKYIFRASGSILNFEGYLKVYKKQEDDKEEDVKIPKLEKDQKLNVVDIKGLQHFTQPPSRYTDAMLVKTLEELEIGRPSTYSTIVTTLTQRGYVIKEQKLFYPTELGEIVNDILKNNFENIVDIEFTANMENELDRIEDGEIEWKETIRSFYPEFAVKIEEAEKNIGEVDIEDEVTDVICDKCGKNMVIKYGKYGKFLACPGFPECRNTKSFFEEAGVNCPLCNGKVIIKKTKKGRRYYGCENNPDCEFMSWNKPTGELCPRCNSFLIEKGTKNIKIVCSNEKCGYVTEKEEKEEK